jgi:hypothetical protein
MITLLFIVLTTLHVVIADNTRFPTCTGVPTLHPTEDVSPTLYPTLWPTAAPFTLWPTGAPQPTPITNFPTTTYYPSFTPAPSPTVSPSTALPTPSYADQIAPPSEIPISSPTPAPSVVPSVSTAAPTGSYWILGDSGNTCNDVCTQSTHGGVCQKEVFQEVITVERFTAAFESSLFKGNCIYPGTLYYNSTVNASTFCNNAFNFKYDPITYYYPGAKVVETIAQGSGASGTSFGYDIICGFGKNHSESLKGRCDQVPNNNVLRLCPCSKPCYPV